MAKAVKPIPEGYRSVTPNLACRNASAAIDFYKKVFGAVVKLQMAGSDGKVMHAELQIGDSIIFVGEPMSKVTVPSDPSDPSVTNPTTMYLYVEDVDAVFNRAVAAGARADFPVQDMFWGDRHGRITDPYGQQWGIATHVKDVTPEELKRGQEAMFAKMSAKTAGHS